MQQSKNHFIKYKTWIGNIFAQAANIFAKAANQFSIGIFIETSSDLITTLTYVLLDNFCPSLYLKTGIVLIFVMYYLLILQCKH